jgi:O-antigen/teichoic acid export membrane protein
LLAANLFLGIYYNLSIWFKLTEKTRFGAYFAIFGAIITVVLNLSLIPIFGFEGAAITTLLCYVSMTIISYMFGQKYYPIPYNIKRIIGYLTLMVIVFLLSITINLGMIGNTLYLAVFVLIVGFLEKPKKRLNSTPELFD